MGSHNHSLGDTARKVPFLSLRSHDAHNKMVNDLGSSLAILPYCIRDEVFLVGNASVHLPSSVDCIPKLWIDDEFTAQIREGPVILCTPDL